MPPERQELWDAYRVAVDEYRFQVSLNATRATQLLLLNAAIVAAGATLAGDGRASAVIAGILLLAGSGIAVCSALASDIQHRYYRRARDHMRAIETALELAPPLPLATTFGMTPAEPRPWQGLTVRRLLEVVFVVIAAADLVAGIYLTGWGG